MAGDSHNSGNVEGECLSQAQQTLGYQQVKRLEEVVSSPLVIRGRWNYPDLRMTVRNLIIAVRKRLEQDGMSVRDVRINGSVARHIVGGDDENEMCNDLDVIFQLDQEANEMPGGCSDRLAVGYDLDQIKDSALMALQEFLDPKVCRERLGPAALSEGYCHRMVKVEPQSGNSLSDRWSLITLQNVEGLPNVDMKFVISMKRQYEFSIDSFQIIVDRFLQFCEVQPEPLATDKNFYPTVIVESAYGNYADALHHAKKRLIALKSPEEIRGGGLLKYCSLRARGYRYASEFNARETELYMCSRFYIDFPDIERQEIQIVNYRRNHFRANSPARPLLEWLRILCSVISRASKCVSANRRNQTLALIERFIAYEQHMEWSMNECLHRQELQTQQRWRAPVSPPLCHVEQQTASATAREQSFDVQKQSADQHCRGSPLLYHSAALPDCEAAPAETNVVEGSDSLSDSAVTDMDNASVSSSTVPSSDGELDRLSSRSASVTDLSTASSATVTCEISQTQMLPVQPLHAVGFPPNQGQICIGYIPYPAVPQGQPAYVVPFIYTTHYGGPVMCGQWVQTTLVHNLPRS